MLGLVCISRIHSNNAASKFFLVSQGRWVKFKWGGNSRLLESFKDHFSGPLIVTLFMLSGWKGDPFCWGCNSSLMILWISASIFRCSSVILAKVQMGRPISWLRKATTKCHGSQIIYFFSCSFFALLGNNIQVNGSSWTESLTDQDGSMPNHCTMIFHFIYRMVYFKIVNYYT